MLTIIAAARNGEDPAAKRDADREAITVTELAERFDREHIALRVKENTAKGYRRMVERVILPALGCHRVTEVTRADIAKLSSGIAAARLLILTGCRLGEIMKLKWDYVDFKGRALRLPDSKTGAKTVHLGQPAIDVLTAIAQVNDNPWVITGTLPGAPLYDLQPFWQRVRARAGLKDVRIHDLRHTFASIAVAGGQGLPMIGKLRRGNRASGAHP